MAYQRSKYGSRSAQSSFQVGQFSVTTTAATFASGFCNSGGSSEPRGEKITFLLELVVKVSLV